jgi:hypothetical protein
MNYIIFKAITGEITAFYGEDYINADGEKIPYTLNSAKKTIGEGRCEDRREFILMLKGIRREEQLKLWKSINYGELISLYIYLETWLRKINDKFPLYKEYLEKGNKHLEENSEYVKEMKRYLEALSVTFTRDREIVVLAMILENINCILN